MQKSKILQSGFTLIELLLVIAIISVLGVLASAFYARFLTQNAALNNSNQIIGLFRKAQTYSMVGKENGGVWGVKYASTPTNQITLFLNGNPAFDETFTVNGNITITPDPFNITFAHQTGIPSSTTPITVTGSNTINTITINSEGIVDQQLAAAPGPQDPPTVTTGVGTPSVTTATLNGSANPNGDDATGYFRYDTTSPGSCNDTFGTRAPVSVGSPLGSGTSVVPFSEIISGLSANTPYYFCAIANNSGGTSFGTVEQFQTDPPPNIQFIASATATANNPASGNFTLPGTAQAGDVAIFWWFAQLNTKTISPPATITQKQNASSAGFGRLYIGYRVLQAGDTTFAWTSTGGTGGGSGTTTVWGTSVFRNVNTTGDPFEAQSGAPITFTNTTSPNPPAVTTISPNATVVSIFGKTNDYSSITPPATYTLGGSASATVGIDASAGVAYFLKPTAGLEDPGAFSAAGASTDDGYVWTGALKPQ